MRKTNKKTIRRFTAVTSFSLVFALGGLTYSYAADSQPAADQSLTPITKIQGESEKSPLAGNIVTTSGVVTAILPGRSAVVVQTPSSQVPSGFKGSSAIFVKIANDKFTEFSKDISVGALVKVKGEVKEQQAIGKDGQPDPKAPSSTILVASSKPEVLETSSKEPVEVPNLVVPKTQSEFQAREYMVFKPQGTFRVNGTDELIYTGQITLNDGPKPLIQPTAAGLPGSTAAKEQAAYNEAHTVILDDGNDQYFDAKFGAKVTPKAPYKLPFVNPGQPGPTLGATASFHQPVIPNLVDKTWVLDPTFTLETEKDAKHPDSEFITFNEVREATPAEVGGDFKLATFNVLNYFSDLGVNGEEKDKDGKKLCEAVISPVDGKTPVAGNWDCPRRGAWDEAGLSKQQAKIVNSINKLGHAGAGVVALQEIENGLQFGPDFDVSLKHLVEALNKADSTLHWQYSPAPKQMPKYGNEDKIRQAFIYRTDLVSLEGESKFLDDPAYQSAADARAPISQAFKVKNSGKVVLVINNHLTYKGGKVVGEDNANPGDKKGPAYDVGRNNGDRLRQAKALTKFADSEKKQVNAAVTLLVGDFNSYNYEDPIIEIVNNGYEDLLNVEKYPSKYSATDWNEYTYSYKSQLGSLDHVMLFQDGLNKLTGLDVWTSNAYEPKVYEYSRYLYTGMNYYKDDVFRASDHSAVLVGFQLKEDNGGTVNPPVPAPNPNPNPAPGTGDKPAPGVTPGGIVPDGNSGGTTPGTLVINNPHSSVDHDLAKTGSTALLVGLIAGVMMVVGGIALAIGRRKR